MDARLLVFCKFVIVKLMWNRNWNAKTNVDPASKDFKALESSLLYIGANSLRAKFKSCIVIKNTFRSVGLSVLYPVREHAR